MSSQTNDLPISAASRPSPWLARLILGLTLLAVAGGIAFGPSMPLFERKGAGRSPKGE